MDSNIRINEFIKTKLNNFDKKYQFEHVCKVMNNSILIWNIESSSLNLSNKDKVYYFEIIYISILIYNSIKYKGHSEDTEYLSNLGLSQQQISDIYSVIDNISYSKERKGLLNLDSFSPELLLARNIVSDAHKIETLGMNGLEKSIENIVYVIDKKEGDKDEIINNMSNANLVNLYLRVNEYIHEKLLPLKDNYILTKTGKQLAEGGHNFLINWCSYWKKIYHDKENKDDDNVDVDIIIE